MSSSGTCACGHNIIAHKQTANASCAASKYDQEGFQVGVCGCKGFMPTKVHTKQKPAISEPQRIFENALAGPQQMVNALSAYLAHRVAQDNGPQARNLKRLEALCEAIETGKMDELLGPLTDAINNRVCAIEEGW